MPENQISKLFRSAEGLVKPETVQINGTGEIPDWLNGIFLRTGPAKWDLNGDFTCNHLMDGFALLSSFSIDSSTQTVSFDKKYLESDAYCRGMAAKRPVFTEFGTPSYPDPRKSYFSKLISACLPLELSDNNSSALFQLGREVFATSETCFFRSIEPTSLATGEKYDSNRCFGVNIDSAHPITDENGTTWNMGSTFLTGLKYNLIRIPAPASSNQSAKEVMKKSKIITSIPSSWTGLMSYNHQSFILTPNYVIFIEQPFVMNIGKAAKSILKGSPTFSQYVEWRPELRNRFFLIEKETGKVLKTEIYAAEAFFFLHFINAYEENYQIIVDLISYENADFFDEMYMDKLRSGSYCHHSTSTQGSAKRYVIPVIHSNVKEVPENVNLVAVKSEAQAVRNEGSIILTPEIMTASGFEYPILNRKRAGKKNAYFYAIGTLGQSEFRNCITKFDLRKSSSSSSRSEAYWIGTETQFPGEPQLILTPNGKAEDDGILISAVTDENPESKDFLLFLDARTMEEVGRAQFLADIPQAFHGLFLQAPTNFVGGQ